VTTIIYFEFSHLTENQKEKGRSCVSRL